MNKDNIDFVNDINNLNLNGEELNRQKAEKLVSRLSPEQKKKLNSILSDKQATEKLLSSPQAQAIIKSLSGKKKKN